MSRIKALSKRRSEKVMFKIATVCWYKTLSLERRLGRSSDQTQKLSLEPRNSRSSQKLKSALARKNSRSSQQLKPSGLQLEACSSDKPLARAKTNPARSRQDKLARAKKYNSQVQNQVQALARATPLWLDPPDTNSTLARATNSSLERRSKNLGSNTRLPNTTNMKQTCPTHPITQYTK